MITYEPYGDGTVTLTYYGSGSSVRPIHLHESDYIKVKGPITVDNQVPCESFSGGGAGVFMLNGANHIIIEDVSYGSFWNYPLSINSRDCQTFACSESEQIVLRNIDNLGTYHCYGECDDEGRYTKGRKSAQ